MQNTYEFYIYVPEINKTNIRKVRKFFIDESFKQSELKEDMRRLFCLNYCYRWNLLDLTRKVKNYFQRTEKLFSEDNLDFSPFAIFNNQFKIGGLIKNQGELKLSEWIISKRFKVGYSKEQDFNLEFCILEDEYMNRRMSFGIRDSEKNLQEIYMIHILAEEGNMNINRKLISNWKKRMVLDEENILTARDKIANYIINQ